jgi:hypothetical protein
MLASIVIKGGLSIRKFRYGGRLGRFRESGTILLSNDVGEFHYDANFIVTEETQGGVRRARQQGQQFREPRSIGKICL